MAQMSYADFEAFSKKAEAPKNYVKYLSLKNDGDVAIVRFNIATLADIRIVSKHTVKNSEGRIRNVMCLRPNRAAPIDMCPLCAAGEKIYFKAFIPLIRYVEDEKGGIVAEACLWEQAARMYNDMKTWLDEYGDLRNYVFKIIRRGKPGDTSTTYSIMPASSNIYSEAVYKKDFSGFDNLDFERFVATRTAEDMQSFLTNGDFPNPFKKEETASTTPAEQPKAAEPAPAPRPAPRVYTDTYPEEPNVLETGPRRYTY